MDSTLPPTERIYNYLSEWRHRYSPSRRDICKGAHISSTSECNRHLEKLEAEGRIWIVWGKQRAVGVIRREAS